jgi:hypothetical protein
MKQVSEFWSIPTRKHNTKSACLEQLTKKKSNHTNTKNLMIYVIKSIDKNWRGFLWSYSIVSSLAKSVLIKSFLWNHQITLSLSLWLLVSLGSNMQKCSTRYIQVNCLSSTIEHDRNTYPILFNIVQYSHTNIAPPK